MPFCGETGDDDGDDDRESVGWVLATVSALRDELRAARDAFFFSERSGVDVGAARRAAGLLPKSGSGGDLRKQLGAPDGGGEGRVSFAPSSELRTPRRRAAAVAFAREASTALRDAMRRVRSPLGRFLKPQAVANMRHMLDEATICGQMAKRLRADELGERLCRIQPLVWVVLTKLQNSLARSNRSRFG